MNLQLALLPLCLLVAAASAFAQQEVRTLTYEEAKNVRTHLAQSWAAIRFASRLANLHPPVEEANQIRTLKRKFEQASTRINTIKAGRSRKLEALSRKLGVSIENASNEKEYIDFVESRREELEGYQKAAEQADLTLKSLPSSARGAELVGISQSLEENFREKLINILNIAYAADDLHTVMLLQPVPHFVCIWCVPNKTARWEWITYSRESVGPPLVGSEVAAYLGRHPLAGTMGSVEAARASISSMVFGNSDVALVRLQELAGQHDESIDQARLSNAFLLLRLIHSPETSRAVLATAKEVVLALRSPTLLAFLNRRIGINPPATFESLVADAAFEETFKQAMSLPQSPQRKRKSVLEFLLGT